MFLSPHEVVLAPLLSVPVPSTKVYGSFLSGHTTSGTGKFDRTVFPVQSEGILSPVH